MRLLALDTATAQATCAVCDADRVLAEKAREVTTHSELLLALIDETLRAAGVSLPDLDAVVCGQGPGSFTGLRIGMATAKGLCFALEVPLLAPSSLEGLARAVNRVGPATVVACLDARRQEIFAAAWRFDEDGASTRLLAPMAGGPAAVAEAVLALDTPTPPILAGTGATLYRDQLTALLGDAAALPTDAPQTPDAAVLADLAADLLAAGDTANLSATEPEYLRPSDAELNRNRPP